MAQGNSGSLMERRLHGVRLKILVEPVRTRSELTFELNPAVFVQ